MYSVVEIAGHQYRVRPGDLFDVEKLTNEEGSLVEFNRVLFVGGEQPVVGLPLVEGATVKAKVIRQFKDKKILMMKRVPGKWRRRKGHRQPLTCLFITEISDGKGKVEGLAKDDARAKKFL